VISFLRHSQLPELGQSDPAQQYSSALWAAHASPLPGAPLLKQEHVL